MWVAGGRGISNTMAYSYDGILWVGLGKTIFTNSCNAIAWGNNMWVAGGVGSETFAHSFDGIDWQVSVIIIAPSMSSTTVDVFCNSIVAYGTNWMACGNIDTVFYSPDGIYWFTRSDYPTNSIIFNSIAWNGNTFLVGGKYESTSTSILMKSSDGISFTELDVTSIFGNIYCIKWNGYVWIVGGITPATSIAEPKFAIAYSYDGINFINITINNTALNSCMCIGINDNNLLINNSKKSLEINSGNFYDAYSSDIGISIYANIKKQ
jgi:hypothetical protein